MDTITILWMAFIALFLAVLFIDIYVSGRNQMVPVKKALVWTGIWIAVAMAFAAAIYIFFPQNTASTHKTAALVAVKFIAGYFTEYSLSVDNLFVFIMIFSMMAVPEKAQPIYLKIGVLLSVVLRIMFIALGMALVQKFEWVMYIFGAILLWTAYKMAFSGEEDEVDPKKNFLYKAAAHLYPVHWDMNILNFFTTVNGKKHITPFFLVFLVIGWTNVIFAMDSIPAIIGIINEGAKGALNITEQNFIAITSNTFAVMGLVSLFFALKGIMGMFRYLKYGVCVILFFISIKMLLAWYHPLSLFFEQHSWFSLAVIIATFIVSILLSIVIKEKVDIDSLKEQIDELKYDISDLEDDGIRNKSVQKI